MADAQGEKVGGGYVEVVADLSTFDAAMAALPRKAAAKMEAARRSLQAEAAKTKIELGLAWKAGDLDNATRAGDALQVIEAKIKAVEAATIKQGQAAQAEVAAAKAAAAEKIAAKAAERAAIQQTAQAARDAAQQAKREAQEEAAARRSLAQQMRQDAQEQLADQRRVAQQFAQAERARQGQPVPGKPGGGTGNMSGAMGLMVLSQTIDDAQYGFRAIVNQIPQLGMGLATMFGKSGEAAMKFGAIAGIAGVAVNYLVNHAGEWANSLGLFAQETTKSADALEALRERIKTLEDKPIKLAVDTFEIDQAKKKLAELEAAARAFKQMGETQSSGEKASGEAVSQKFSSLGAAEGDKIQGDLKAKMAQELLAQSETIKEADREAARAVETQRKAELRLQHAGSQGGQMQAIGDIEAAKARVKAAQEAAAKARLAITKEGGEAEREVGKIWADATKGNVEAQKKLVERLKAIGQNALATSIESIRPDLMESEKEDPDVARTNEFNIAVAAKAREARAAEDSRLAGAMQGSVGQSYLKMPTMSDETMQAEVKKAMEKAGMSAKEVAEAVAGTAKKLRENLDEAVVKRSLDRGIDDGVARQQLLKEAQQRDAKQANQPQAEIMSDKAYLDKLLVGALNQDKNDVPEKQLTEAQTMNKKLDTVIKVLGDPKKSGPATFARGR